MHKGYIGGTRVGWWLHVIVKYWLGTNPIQHMGSAWCLFSHLWRSSTAGKYNPAGQSQGRLLTLTELRTLYVTVTFRREKILNLKSSFSGEFMFPLKDDFRFWNCVLLNHKIKKYNGNLVRTMIWIRPVFWYSDIESDEAYWWSGGRQNFWNPKLHCSYLETS